MVMLVSLGACGDGKQQAQTEELNIFKDAQDGLKHVGSVPDKTCFNGDKTGLFLEVSWTVFAAAFPPLDPHEI